MLSCKGGTGDTVYCGRYKKRGRNIKPDENLRANNTLEM
jgi:hypothetical protein